MKKKLKLSQWHDGNVKPVHVGVYQSAHCNWYRKWNGKRWMWGAATPTIAARENRDTALSQDCRWRGIVK